MTRAAGFTLFELLIVMVMVAVLTAVAVPSFRGFTSGQDLKNVSQSLYMDLAYTRSEAVKRNATVELKPNGGTWGDGWFVTTDTAVTAIDCSTDAFEAGVLRAGCSADGSGVRFEASPGSVTFAGNGRPGSSAVFTLCDANRLHARQVRVGIDGLPEIQRLDSCP